MVLVDPPPSVKDAFLYTPVVECILPAWICGTAITLLAAYIVRLFFMRWTTICWPRAYLRWRLNCRSMPHQVIITGLETLKPDHISQE
eukprot:SAG11_NODE_28287_length_323_cov_0.919643_1_plen_87_part_10